MKSGSLNGFMQLGLFSDVTFFGELTNSLVAELLSGLPCSLVALTFNEVTDKMSSSILIY
jgi:hypothetical protein